MDYFLIWVFPALLLGGFGFFLFWATTRHINRCKAVAGWIKTKGTIDRAVVEEQKSQRFNRATRTGYKRIYYEPKIEYSYSVSGSIYHSSGYRNFNGMYHDNSEEKAAEIVADYPTGKSVTVTFDPINPADAYLVPETDTTRLGEHRMIQIVMIAIALVWLGLGSSINLLGQLKAENAQKQIQQNPGLLPIIPEQIESDLNSLITQYGLACSDEGYSGKTLAYKERRCSNGDVSNLTTFEIDARKEDNQKIDLISAISTPTDLEATRVFFDQVAAIVFDDPAKGTVSDWIVATIPEVIESGSTVTTIIDNIPLTLSNLGQNIRFSLGEIQ